VRTLTAAEVDDLTSRLRTHRRAVELDVADLVDFMLGTGLRLGEVCAVRTGKNADGQPLARPRSGPAGGQRHPRAGVRPRTAHPGAPQVARYSTGSGVPSARSAQGRRSRGGAHP